MFQSRSTTRLRRLGATTATLIALGAAACENPQPPAACGAMPEVTVHAKETATATACFEDPNGDVLTYSATSGNPGVATVSISGTTITISAVAPGTASVTVAATDPGGLQGEQSFQVTVPNRPPAPRGTIPAMAITVGRTGSVDVSSYFTEPDGQALTYSATSSAPAVATVFVAGTTVEVAAMATGTATVTVTATDPGGLSATQTYEVWTRVEESGFRDDFDSSASLDDWELAEARVMVKNGVLELTNTEDIGLAERELSAPIASWTVSTRMGRVETTGFHVAVLWATLHERYPIWGFFIGRGFGDVNYFLAPFDAVEEAWQVSDELSGVSAAVNEGTRELTTVAVSFKNSRIKAVAGSTVLFDLEASGEVARSLGIVGSVGLVAFRKSGSTALFDWIEVEGETVTGAARFLKLRTDLRDDLRERGNEGWRLNVPGDQRRVPGTPRLSIPRLRIQAPRPRSPGSPSQLSGSPNPATW